MKKECQARTGAAPIVWDPAGSQTMPECHFNKSITLAGHWRPACPRSARTSFPAHADVHGYRWLRPVRPAGKLVPEALWVCYRRVSMCLHILKAISTWHARRKRMHAIWLRAELSPACRADMETATCRAAPSFRQATESGLSCPNSKDVPRYSPPFYKSGWGSMMAHPSPSANAGFALAKGAGR